MSEPAELPDAPNASNAPDTPTPPAPPARPSAEDTAAWQKRLAAQANNRAWALADQPTRSAAEAEDMLHAAHAACYFWRIVGQPRNQAHAAMLLAHVYALLGLAHPAQHHAAQAWAFFDAEANAPWETAFIQAIRANVAAASGDAHEHLRWYRLAEASIAALSDPEDQAILRTSLQSIPRPAA